MRTLSVLSALTLALLCGCGKNDDDGDTKAETTKTAATPTPSVRDEETLAEAGETQVPSGVKRSLIGRDVYVRFSTPSGYSRCDYTTSQTLGTASLRCDFTSDVAPLPKPAGCEYDWGATITLQPRGRSKPGCVSDAVDPGSSVLAYGDTWSEGGIACASRPTGLRCVNERGHGFNLTRERQDRF